MINAIKYEKNTFNTRRKHPNSIWKQTDRHVQTNGDV
jgi:hypothetical protein